MSITVNKKTDEEGYFGSEYYYEPVIDGKTSSFIAETEDIALIIGLAIKYDGHNTQAHKMFFRMLNIKTSWAE